jgi:serine/threonine-protein kinase HipA
VSIKVIDVLFNSFDGKVKVGRLALRDKTIYFEYEKEFLAKGIELSPYKLPLKNGVHICDDTMFEGLFGVFADSLPDGWGRLLLDRHFLKQGVAYSDITPLDRLSYIGNYGVGTLSYEPIFENMEVKNLELDLDLFATSSLNILRGTSQELLDTLLAIGGSSSGARPKAVIQIDKNGNIIHGVQKLEDGFQHYLVKFASSSDSKDIGKLEYIYSLMAKDAGINMPQTKLLNGKENSYFAIKRFDRIEDNRVHIHSVAGMVHSDFRLPSLDYDDLLVLTLHLTKDKEEQKKMFRLAVFNLFTHNRDDHAKNFSFLLDRNNNWKLAPAYDLTFSFGPGGEHSTTYLGEGKNSNSKHLTRLAIKHDIANYTSIIDEIKAVALNFMYYLKKVDANNKIYSDILKYIQC